ncbi:sugar O-acetyltransferase [Companilactobacillus pabuli]|jgi:maltose O-acetyltransferase|uniref:Acetyltransferase n=1 Tax=Companilactobacillus pabuli TaxID=2714036 RepID=A0A7L7KY20_9LACO|nr:sugar O-acetyltransferase [Companilactobacillus pabuli]AKP02204.1 maltose acetyltransferase [Companilactobacillus farciminis]AKS50501.1 maltose acetyltransferase [Companilactobacillus farciminis]MDG5113586.1 sugar O-acetyltransferase [Companilactobacillus pabuli]QMT83688.1 sugar O-acetyltransferase [Companilactobacillus pabuli]GAQ02549.1 maltose O-acetyltransferase [Companilactobacillus farciminis]
MRSQKERMLSGDLYIADDPELAKDFHKAKRLLREYNQTTEYQEADRQAILKDLFKQSGKKIHIEPPFHTDYGCNTVIGENFYSNYDCIILDIANVKIGDNVMFGPRVGLYTAGHPIDAVIRNEHYEYGKPITIGNNVWVGGNVVFNPGVTVGDNVVIGSGSIVTKDIPSSVIAVGNPCKVLRKINDQDKKYWEMEKKRYFEQ